MDIISRLKLYMEVNNISSSQFADTAGIPRPTLSQLLNGRNKMGDGAKKISSDIIRKIHDAYPELSVMWLLFGDGDMVDDENIQFSEGLKDGINQIKNYGSSGSSDFRPMNLFDEYSESGDEQPVVDNKTENQTPESHRSTAGADEAKSKSKKIESIMVFYSDNSFEIFKPSL